MKSALMKVALSGGAPVLFAPYDMAFRGDWGPDNNYYWTTHYFGPIVRTAGFGSQPEPVTELDLRREERTHRHVQFLPGGEAIILTVSSGGIQSFDDARIDLCRLDTKKRITLVQGGFSPRYSPSGHIVYARAGSLYAVPFDLKRLEVTGPPFKVVDGVFMSTNSGSAHFDISRTGALAYAVGRAEGGDRTLVWVDRNGKADPLPLPPRSYVFPRISPDGTQLAVEVEGVNHDLYTWDFDRGVMTKMTTDGLSHAPVWTPDGKHIAYRSWKAGTMTMWWMPSDRSGPEERLTSVGARQSVVSFSPDGRYMAFNQMETSGMGMGPGEMGIMGSGSHEMDAGGTGVWILPMQGDRTPRPFVRSKFTEGSGRFSPDGKWVAYCSNESGRNEVFVQQWPGPGPKIKISSEGGTDPIWSRNGKELFYRNGNKMMAVQVATQPVFKPSKPQLLWEAPYAHGMSSSCGPPGTTEGNYDVASDGSRFLMIKDLSEDLVSTRIVVVLNFAEELKALASAQKHP
jgi:serine/threonine-protein kinase